MSDVSSVNKVILIGNLGADPVLRRTQSGRSVANLRLATNERWNDGQGQSQERTQWHRIVVWGKLAEICDQHLRKGRRIYVEGRLENGSYEKDGQTHYTTEITAQNILFLDSKGGSSEPPSPPSTSKPKDEEPPF